MDVALPIASVIPTLDGPVLAALAGTASPLSLSDVHRLAGRGSISGVRKVLVRLTGTGLVQTVPGGYLLNRDHVAAAAVEVLAGLHGELNKRVREVLDAWDGEVALAGVFGSAARRDGDEDSDIDILVVSDSEGLDELSEHLTDRVSVWTGNAVQVVAITRVELARLQRAREPILETWERDLVVLCGDRRVLRAVA